MNIIIQPGLFNSADDKLWWSEPLLWDHGHISTIWRPTEDEAFNRIYKQAKILRKKGVYINLSHYHLQAMKLEYQCKHHYGFYRQVYEWIAERMSGFTKLQIKALLDEASIAFALRHALGLPEIDVQWDVEPVIVIRKVEQRERLKKVA